MKRRFALIAVLCMACITVPVSAQVKGLNKEELEGDQQTFIAPDGSGFQISPDGKMLAYFGLFKDAPNVFVTGVNGGEKMQASFVGDAGVESFYWLKNNLIAYVTAPGSSGMSALYVGDFTAGEFRRVSAENTHVRVLGVSSRDGFVHYEMNSAQNPYRYDYYLFSAQDMSSKLKASNVDNALQWASDMSMGQAFSYAYRDGKVVLINSAGEKFSMLEQCLQFKPLAPSVIHKGNYYCISDSKRNGAALVEISLTDGTEKEVLFAKAGSSVDRVFLSPKEHRPVMVWYRGKENGFQLVDKKYSTMLEDMKSKVKNAEALQLISCSNDENVWIVLNEFYDGRKAYYRYNVANKDMRQLNPVDLTYEIQIAKVVMQTITDTRGNEMVLRIYSPPVVEVKYPAILVFGEGMWALNSQPHDSLMMVLGVNGYPVVEVDLLHSKSYGATALLNGYEWWSNMLVSDIPVVLKAISQKFPTIPGVVPFGIGIGAETAMHAMSIHPDLKNRSVLVQPQLNEGIYATALKTTYDPALRYMLKSGDEIKDKSTDYLGAASNPMVVYSTLDTEYAERMNALVQNFAISGNTPVVVNYSDNSGIPKTPAARFQMIEELSRYISAVPVRKIK